MASQHARGAAARNGQYETALRELIAQKTKGKAVKATKPANDDGKVIDLMAALKRSLQGGNTPRAAARISTVTKSAAKKPAGKRVA